VFAGLDFMFFIVSLGKRVVRGALKLLKRSARYSGRFVSERRMRSDLIVVVSPKRQVSAGVIESVEDLLIQLLVSQAPIEAFDEAILLGLVRVN
jgi:hypothetical protein